jgi:hypothetical protein
MHTRRWVSTSLAVTLVIASAASMDPVQAQKVDKNVEKAKKEEIQAVLKIAQAEEAGQPAPTDISGTFHADFLKAQESRTYVPFTLVMPAVPAPPKNLTMYVRVVAKTAAAPATTDKDKADKDKADKDKADKDKGTEYAFEDAYFVDLVPPAANQPYRVSRAFSVPAGDYDVLIILKERPALGEKDKKDKNAVFKAGLMKQSLTVPDFWNGELATSSVLLAENVEPLAAPLTREEAVQQPYTLGNTKITLAMSNLLPKKSELSVVFIIYNTTQDPNKKPDVSVEYTFFQKVAAAENGEKHFNKTNPQNFNAATLPAQFDPTLGHQLVAGQSVPLASFPEGDYRLEIKITDKLSGKTVIHNLPFKVTA